MKTMYIWMDYMCMPQPSLPDNGEREGTGDKEQTGMMQTHALGGAMSPEYLQNELPQDSRRRSHRSSLDGLESDVTGRLSDAVDSLPAYVELSWMMLVLAPTVEHRDRLGETVDWCSWRTRGWSFPP